MKKLFLTLVVAMISTTAMFAQTSLLATLSHEGEISTFYGANALREAHAAAANGDVITLSSGTFNSVDITKGITLRGAGMTVDAATQTEPTVIAGTLKINVPESVEERLTVEGLFFNEEVRCSAIKNAVFLKDRFYSVSSSDLTNAAFIHCYIKGLNCDGTSSVNYTNCVVWKASHGSSANAYYDNCVIGWNGLSHSYEDNYYLTLKNCIIIRTADVYLNRSNVAYNCLGICTNSFTDNQRLFKNIQNTTNTELQGDGSGIFATFTGIDYTDENTFELTEEAQTQYLGLDGTQVGIYGGYLPFDATPTNPQITKCNVASKSTADGKLSVDIEVRAAE